MAHILASPRITRSMPDGVRPKCRAGVPVLMLQSYGTETNIEVTASAAYLQAATPDQLCHRESCWTSPAILANVLERCGRAVWACWMLVPKVQMSSSWLQQIESIAQDTRAISKLRSFAFAVTKYAQVVPRCVIDLADILTEFRTNARSGQNSHPLSNCSEHNPHTPEVQDTPYAYRQSYGKRSTTASAKRMWIPNFPRH